MCPECKGSHTVRLGFDVRCGQSAYVCIDCSKASVERDEQLKVFHVPLLLLGRAAK